MNAVDIITKKRDGLELTDNEIEYMVTKYTCGELPDYQMSAFLMAVYFRGMSKSETVALTNIMKLSGDVLDLSDIPGIKVDKHSTGGVGDKTTLIVGPIVAACGIPVAKMSGRGLGFTGGTVDKLESIPGFKVSLEYDEFVNQVNNKGIAVISQTGHIAPADKKIYALRDVTGTVENLSLITSSIMSKKLASGSDAILLDVKCGNGAFMKNEEDAEKLASMMVEIGTSAGKETIAVITDMNQPLGRAIGNSLEVKEAIQVLKNQGTEDITELSVTLAGMMIYMGKKASTIEEGIKMAENALKDGSALQKFKAFVEGQGGDPDITENMKLLPTSGVTMELRAWKDGYISEIDAMQMGLASQHTGAGRECKDDDIDLSAGIYINKKVGEFVEKHDLMCTIYGNDSDKLENSLKKVRNAIKISGQKPKINNIIKKVVKK